MLFQSPIQHKCQNIQWNSNTSLYQKNSCTDWLNACFLDPLKWPSWRTLLFLFWLSDVGSTSKLIQGGHWHKSGILRDFSERGTHGILSDFCATSGETYFALWMRPVSNNPYAAKCICCTRTVDLSNMGRHALVSHMSSNWCGMTPDIWRSLLGILFVAITSEKVYLHITLEKPGSSENFFLLLCGHPVIHC